MTQIANLVGTPSTGRAVAAALSIAVLLADTTTNAQPSGPEKGIRVLYGCPSCPERPARLVAEKLGESLKIPISFENVPAAGGNIAADRAANANPDGRTLYIAGAPTLAINVSLDDSLSYSPVRDFAPVTQLFSFPHVLVIHKSIPAADLQEFLVLARAQPGHFTYGHFGNGSPVHLATERLKLITQTDLKPVAYRTSNSLVQDLRAGRISACLCEIAAGMSLVRQGLARALAITSAERSQFAPRLPTMKEAGIANFEFTSWLGLVVPAGTPAHIIGDLHRHAARVLARSDTRAAMGDFMMRPIGNTPAQFAISINQEIKRWAEIIEETSVRLHN